MTDDNKTPPEVIEEAQRRARRDIVREVNATLGNSSPLAKHEQANILRRVADQLDKAEERTGVLASSKQRLDAKYRPTSFFTGQDRHRAYWEGRAKSPDYKAGERAAVKARSSRQQDQDQEPTM